MRTGDIRRGPGPVHGVGVVLVPVLRPVGHVARDGGRGRRSRHEHLADVEDAHQVVGGVRIAFLTGPLVGAGADARFEQQLVGERRRVLHLLDTLRVEVAETVRLGRGRRRGRAAERRRARALAADRLLIPDKCELVTLRRLPRDARGVVLPGAIRERRLAVVAGPGPGVGVARVQVVVQVQRVLPLALLADAHVEPELVLDDRPAHRHVEVVDVVDRIRRTDAARCQFVVVVVRLHPLREPRAEHHPGQVVAALLRDDVDGEAGGFRLAKAARGGHRDFGGVANVGDVIRRLVAAGRVADVEAVHRQARFDAAAAVDREDREHRAGVDVVVVGLHAGNGGEQVAVAADAGKIANRLVVDRDFALRRLHVHHGRFAGDGDRFLHAADPEFAVDRDDRRSGHGDVLTLERDEARQGERERVIAGPQIDDTVTTRTVGDRRTDLLDQRRARSLDRHSGQDAPRTVPDDARQGRLREGCRLAGDQARQDQPYFDQLTHSLDLVALDLESGVNPMRAPPRHGSSSTAAKCKPRTRPDVTFAPCLSYFSRSRCRRKPDFLDCWWDD